MLIDDTSFTGLILIPNVTEPDPNNRTTTDLAQLIDTCEYEVLSFAFGVVMFNDFIANYQTDPEYIKIVEGETYQKDDKTYIWKGLADNPIERSLLVDYVYYRWQTDNVTQQTEFGQVAMDNKIGNKASSTPKIVKSWNTFLLKFQGGKLFNGANGFTPEGNPYWVIENRLGNGYGISYFGGNLKGGEVSLLQYLSDKKENLPLLDNENTKFGLQRKNSFGI